MPEIAALFVMLNRKMDKKQNIVILLHNFITVVTLKVEDLCHKNKIVNDGTKKEYCN